MVKGRPVVLAPARGHKVATVVEVTAAEAAAIPAAEAAAIPAAAAAVVATPVVVAPVVVAILILRVEVAVATPGVRPSMPGAHGTSDRQRLPAAVVAIGTTKRRRRADAEGRAAAVVGVSVNAGAVADIGTAIPTMNNAVPACGPVFLAAAH